MILTKITKIEWASIEDILGNANFDATREAKISEMITAGKTDGYAISITDVIYERYWIDQPAAQEYIDFITASVIQYNLNLVSTQILDAP